MAAFKASAQSLDQGVGTVLAALDAEGLAGNTLIICTTDHGLAFPGMKCTLTDHGTGIMLMMRGPGGFVGGKTYDAMVSHIDLFPTICDLLKIEWPAWLQGKSLMPLVQNMAELINQEIFTEVTYHAAYEPQRAVRTTRWKYIRRFGDRRTPVLCNRDDSPSKTLFMQYGWKDRYIASDQLYALFFDPNEACKLVNDPSLSTILEEMRTRLDRWMRATDDPLLRGPIPAPTSAELNDPDQVSSNEPTRIV